MKKPIVLWGLLSSAAVILAACNAAQAAFNDVNSSHENKDAIEYVQAQGIVQGYADGTYKPDNKINRAEFTKIVIEAQFEKAEIDGCETTVFNDVPTAQWFAKYVCLAQKKGVIAGYPDGTFKPGNNIKFTEAAKIIANTLYGTVQGAEPWYRSFVEKLANEKSIPTSIAEFGKEITRGEMAEMIYRLKADVKTKSSQTYASIEAGPRIILDVNGGSLPEETVRCTNHILGVEMIEGDFYYPDSSGNTKCTCTKDGLLGDDGTQCGGFSGTKLAGGGTFAPYLEFNRADYEAATASGKIIMLHFNSDSCSACQTETENLKTIFNTTIVTDDLIAFQVNQNDVQTLASLGYSSSTDPNAKVFMQNGQVLKTAKEQWDGITYVEEIYNLLNAQPQPEPQAGVKEYDVVAQQWSFVPSVFAVDLGDTVKMRVHTIDVAHGVSIPDFNVNKVIDPGQTVEIEFVADKKGEFDIFCSVYCGAGHPDMKATLIVE